jgi:hypothetical protein
MFFFYSFKYIYFENKFFLICIKIFHKLFDNKNEISIILTKLMVKLFLFLTFKKIKENFYSYLIYLIST